MTGGSDFYEWPFHAFEVTGIRRDTGEEVPMGNQVVEVPVEEV